MTLNDIDTSRFLCNPRKADFVENMKNMSNVFDLNISRVNTKKLLIYIALMYDKESYCRKEIKRYLERKTKSAILAGFVLNDDGMFSREVENVLVGQNNSFNKAVVQYAVLQFDIEYAKLVVYELNLHKLLISSMGKWDDKGNAKKQMDDLSAEIAGLELKIFGGEEVLSMRKALYEGTTRTRTKLKPEDVLDEYKIHQLKDWSPYGKGYEIENITFVGDQLPKEDAL